MPRLCAEREREREREKEQIIREGFFLPPSTKIR